MGPDVGQWQSGHAPSGRQENPAPLGSQAMPKVSTLRIEALLRDPTTPIHSIVPRPPVPAPFFGCLAPWLLTVIWASPPWLLPVNPQNAVP